MEPLSLCLFVVKILIRLFDPDQQSVGSFIFDREDDFHLSAACEIARDLDIELIEPCQVVLGTCVDNLRVQAADPHFDCLERSARAECRSKQNQKVSIGRETDVDRTWHEASGLCIEIGDWKEIVWTRIRSDQQNAGGNALAIRVRGEQGWRNAFDLGGAAWRSTVGFNDGECGWPSR